MNLQDSLELKKSSQESDYVHLADSVHVTANKNAALELLLRMQHRYVSGIAEHVSADTAPDSIITTISHRSSNYG